VHMEELSNVLLTDQTADTLPSRKAVDEFLAYVATCRCSRICMPSGQHN
jgi:hypothetical protein